MKQQPDKLFRDKLERYQKAAPASAWDRIAAAQAKKKGGKLWLKVAAALLLLTCATAIFLTTHKDGRPEHELAANDGQSPVAGPATDGQRDADTPTQGSSPASGEAGPLPRSEAPVTAAPSRTTPEKKQASRTHKVAEAAKEAAADNAVAMRRTEAAAISTDAPALGVVESTPAAKATNVPASVPASVTLVYSAAEVSAYLNKNNDDEATADDKKQSTLKKLLQKANDLKTNQDPFGELRQRKNEILALNFKNDKRGQKTTN